MEKNNEIETAKRPVVIVDEDAIVADLERAGVTEEELDRIFLAVRDLTIDGVEDVAGFERVRRARLDARKLRTTIEKVCKAGRAEANRIREIWISTEKKYTERISRVEDRLASEEDRVVAERSELERLEREREFRRAQIENRVRMLSEYGRTATFEEMERLSDDEFLDLTRTIRAAEQAERDRLAAAENAKRAEEERILAEERANLRAERARMDAEREAMERERAAQAAQAAADREAMERNRAAKLADAFESVPMHVAKSAELSDGIEIVDDDPVTPDHLLQILKGWRFVIGAPPTGSVNVSEEDLALLAESVYEEGFAAGANLISE